MSSVDNKESVTNGNFPYLKTQKRYFLRSVDEKWSESNLVDGFEYYHKLYGHYPSTPEIDNFEFLPSAKYFERNFGGVKKARLLLGLKYNAPDHNSGIIRSEMASEADGRAKVQEAEFYFFLIKNIPEMRVHEHKVIRFKDFVVNSDFFIYTNKNKGIIIDIFYAKDLKTLMKIVAIKIPKYLKIELPTFFVLVGNIGVRQQDIDHALSRKKVPIPSHVTVCTEVEFKRRHIPGVLKQIVN